MDELLDLLHSPVNEKKFTGLLLATKLLPAGDAAAVKAVYDAVGISFINRLLLTLSASQSQGRAVSEEQHEVRAASAGLGLAVLAGFSRVPELAQSQDLIQNVPLLLKVLRNSGVEAILQPGGSCAPAVEVGAVHDALESLVAIAGASEEGRLVALQSGAIAAAATALQDAVLHAELVPLAVGFLSVLLQGSSRLVLVSVTAEQGEVLAAAVPPLAQLLAQPPQPQMQPTAAESAGPAAPAGDKSSISMRSLMIAAAANAAPVGQPQLPAADVAQTDPTPHAEGAAADAPEASSEPPSASAEVDAVAVQLDVLHALLLLLPAPEGSNLARLLAESAAAAAKPAGGWPGDLRAGVASVLRAHAPPATKQAALALAAAAVDLAGPAWLAGPAAEAQAGLRGAFYQLAVELVAIETKVLLMDALREAPLEEAGDAPQKATSGTPVQQTAERLLPSCFRLLEAAVELLAADSQDGTGLLDPRVAGRALDTLDGAFEAVLQFLEQVLAPGGLGDGPLTLAALRALASYLADLPQAHAQRVRALLPALLAVTGGAGPGSGLAAAAFLLPLLKQATGLGAAEEAVATGASAETDAWLATIEKPQVVISLARAAAEAASLPESGEADKEDSRYTRAALTDLCGLLLHPVSPHNPRNASLFPEEPGQRSPPRWLVKPGGGDQLRALTDAVNAISARWVAVQAPGAGHASMLPETEDVRLTMAAGALAAAAVVAAAAAAAAAAQPPGTRPPHEAILRLVAAALQLGFRVAVDLQRPTDIVSDDEMTELVDEVGDRWNDASAAAAALAASSPDVQAALAADAWVAGAMRVPEAELRQWLGGREGRASPFERLLAALGGGQQPC